MKRLRQGAGIIRTRFFACENTTPRKKSEIEKVEIISIYNVNFTCRKLELSTLERGGERQKMIKRYT